MSSIWCGHLFGLFGKFDHADGHTRCRVSVRRLAAGTGCGVYLFIIDDDSGTDVHYLDGR